MPLGEGAGVADGTLLLFLSRIGDKSSLSTAIGSDRISGDFSSGRSRVRFSAVTEKKIPRGGESEFF